MGQFSQLQCRRYRGHCWAKQSKLEKILHKLFSPAQLDITIEDRFGKPVQPKEWFLAPLNVIDEAIQAIINGNITQLTYDPATAQLK